MARRTERRDFLKTLGRAALVASVSGISSCKRPGPGRLQNFVIIFADDLGYADVGCYGAEGFETPNLNELAAQGVRFTDFYVPQAVCSASRAALLTGCYPNRVSILHALMPQAENGISSDEETLAEVLKKRGYVCGIFGKWHLGHHREFLPLQHGFDEYFGLPYSNDMWPVDFDGRPVSPDAHKARHPYPPLIEGDEKVSEVRTLEDQDRLTTFYTERAVRFIEKNKDRPFFLYIPHSMVHIPLGVSKKFRGKSRQGMYGDAVMEIDWSVGEILKALEKAGLERTTLVVFSSDNGPWLNFGNHAGSAGPLREGKGSEWEGGIRVPCIMRWAGRIKPGSVCREMAATMDILPTFAATAGAPLPEKKIDGFNILPLLTGETGVSPRQELFCYYGTEFQAVRQGKWKLHVPHSYTSYEGLEPGRDGFPGPTQVRKTGYELYDLEKDVGERHNVIELFPDVAERLLALAERAREELGDGGRTGREVRPCGQIDKSLDHSGR
jgi:arylsulfatase A-like enzyme